MPRQYNAPAFKKKQLAKAEKAIDNMLNAIQSGIFTESTKHRLEELEQSKKETEVAMLQEKIARPTLTKEQIKFWICKWRDTDTNNEKERKKLIDVFVNAVYHYDNELVIMFNHKDGDKMITLDEVGEKRARTGGGVCSDKVENSLPT